MNFIKSNLLALWFIIFVFGSYAFAEYLGCFAKFVETFPNWNYELFKNFVGVSVPVIALSSSGYWNQKSINEARRRWKEEVEKKEEEREEELKARKEEIELLNSKQEEERLAKYRPSFVIDRDSITPIIDISDAGIRNIELYDIGAERIVESVEYIISGEKIIFPEGTSGNNIVLLCETMQGEVVIYSRLASRYDIHLKYRGPVKDCDHMRAEVQVYGRGVDVIGGCGDGVSADYGQGVGDSGLRNETIVGFVLDYYTELIHRRVSTRSSKLRNFDSIIVSKNYFELYSSVCEYIFDNWDIINSAALVEISSRLSDYWINHINDTSLVYKTPSRQAEFLFGRYPSANNTGSPSVGVAGDDSGNSSNEDVDGKFGFHGSGGTGLIGKLIQPLEDGSDDFKIVFSELYWILREFSLICNDDDKRNLNGKQMANFLTLLFKDAKVGMGESSDAIISLDESDLLMDDGFCMMVNDKKQFLLILSNLN